MDTQTDMSLLQALRPRRVVLDGDTATAEQADYVLLEPLPEGRIGGMGVVWAAKQMCMGGRKVAIKIPQKKNIEDMVASGANNDLLPLFFHEAHITAYLKEQNVPGIVDVYEFGRGDKQSFTPLRGSPFYTMEILEGAVWKIQARKKDEERNLHVFMQVAKIVQKAHSAGVLHLDIKPDNVKIGHDGQVWLLDWGLAVRQQENGAWPATDGAGTYQYMAPEIANRQKEKVGPATDVYLLGGVLHQILTGLPPHPGRTQNEVLANAKKGRIVRTDCAHALWPVVKKALAVQPQDRYQRVEDLRAAIREKIRIMDEDEENAYHAIEYSIASLKKRFDYFNPDDKEMEKKSKRREREWKRTIREDMQTLKAHGEAVWKNQTDLWQQGIDAEKKWAKKHILAQLDGVIDQALGFIHHPAKLAQATAKSIMHDFYTSLKDRLEKEFDPDSLIYDIVEHANENMDAIRESVLEKGESRNKAQIQAMEQKISDEIHEKLQKSLDAELTKAQKRLPGKLTKTRKRYETQTKRVREVALHWLREKYTQEVIDIFARSGEAIIKRIRDEANKANAQEAKAAAAEDLDDRLDEALRKRPMDPKRRMLIRARRRRFRMRRFR